MKFHASYNPQDLETSIADPRSRASMSTIIVPRREKREGVVMNGWATPASHMNTVRVRGGLAESLYKITTTVLSLFVLYSGLTATGGTISYYADSESSLDNLLVADPLGFTLSLLGPSQVNMSEGSAFVVPVLIPNIDSEPIQFSVTGHMTSGDNALCSHLHILATTSVAYDGPLYTFTTVMSTSTGEVPLYITAEEGSVLPENSSCFVELLFKGRNADAPLGQGYSDEKILTVQFFVPATTSPLPESSVGGTPTLPDPVIDLVIATGTPTTTEEVLPFTEIVPGTLEVVEAPPVTPNPIVVEEPPVPLLPPEVPVLAQ